MGRATLGSPKEAVAVVDRPDWVPAEVDIDRPSAARMYDFYLGGCHNFEVDRRAAAVVAEGIPRVAEGARINRAFLRRVVRFLARHGIRQYLDIGSGIPTAGNVHEIAQRADPSARVVYVDNDPIAVTHSQAMLAGVPGATAILADLRRPEEILTDPAVREGLDLSQPVAVLLLAVLHFIEESDDPARIIHTLREAMAPGSYLAISHGTADGLPKEASAGTQAYRQTANPLTLRSRAEIIDLFDGFTLVEPGVVWLPDWRPEEPAPPLPAMLGGVGRLDAPGSDTSPADASGSGAEPA